MEVELSTPYNLVEASGKLLGLDAYFWNKLSTPYRRVLLIRNAKDLSREPTGCTLNFEVNVEDQVRELAEIANIVAPLGESRRGVPLSLLRVASLIVPYRVVERAWESRVNSMVVDEVEIAKIIARGLLGIGSLKPLGERMWLNVRFKGGFIEDRVLGYLSRAYSMFSSSLVEVVGVGFHLRAWVNRE